MDERGDAGYTRAGVTQNEGFVTLLCLPRVHLAYGAPNRSTMAEIAAATTAVQSSSGQRQSMTLVFLCFRLFPRGVKLTSKCLGIFIRIFQSDRAT